MANIKEMDYVKDMVNVKDIINVQIMSNVHCQGLIARLKWLVSSVCYYKLHTVVCILSIGQLC